MRTFKPKYKLIAVFGALVVLVLVIYDVTSKLEISPRPIHIRNFSETRRKWISLSAQAAHNLNFTSTQHPMVRHSAPIIPNVVHYVKFRTTEISFTELVTMLSVHINHRPEVIYVHCSLCLNGVTMGGRYWDMLMVHNPPIVVRHFPEPTEIFGRHLASRYHASDIARMLILMEHGGIYLDNDVYVINPLDEFLHYEMTLGWDKDEYLGTQVLIAHKNARYLPLWRETYHNYDGSQWYFNAGQLPTDVILRPKPYLVNHVKTLFGLEFSMGFMHRLYKSIWPQWQEYYTIHLLFRHRYLMDSFSPIVTFDENNIRTYARTFGQMARKILYNTTDIIL